MGSDPVLQVAALELPHCFEDIEKNFSAVASLLSTLQEQEQGPGREMGIDLALLPEAALTGYVSPAGSFDLARFGEPIAGGTAERLAALAHRYRVALAGPLIERAGDRLFNTLLLFDRAGERIGHWRKRHPWYPETWATPGDLGTPTVELAGFRVTAGICFDVHFLSEDAGPTLDAADVLLFPSAWVDDNSDERSALLPTLARRHGIWIVNANWGKGRPRVPGQGTSRIVDPKGNAVAVAERSLAPQAITATIRKNPGSDETRGID